MANFTSIPKADVRRSKFHIPFNHKTTFNTGELIPFYVQEVLPGDTHNVKTSFVLRMSTPINPIMDNIYVDVNYFYVPNRTVYQNWVNVMGQNDESAWTQEETFLVPTISLKLNDAEILSSLNQRSIAAYMGIPMAGPDDKRITINTLPFRAYVKIYNEWYRNQNIQGPIFNPITYTFDQVSSSDYGLENEQYAHLGASLPLRSNKAPDYFTSALPSPQKGPRVLIPMSGLAPVYSSATEIPTGLNEDALRWREVAGGAFATKGSLNVGTAGRTFTQSDTDIDEDYSNIAPINLQAKFTNQTTDIEDLRKALAIQSFYETDARGGTRYTEILLSHFGVSAPDAELQRSIFLGGHRETVVISQVLANATTPDNTALGETGAFSLTVSSKYSFDKSFTEHGFIIGIATVRTHQTYQFGLEKFWTRKSKFDYYWDEFANLGEQAVLTDEIFVGNSDMPDGSKRIFGYQEAWADYRYKPSIVTGAFKSDYKDGTLDSWHLAQNFEEAPILNEEFIRQDETIVDRVLAQSAKLSSQWIMDILVDNNATRPLPVYSIPGISNKL